MSILGILCVTAIWIVRIARPSSDCSNSASDLKEEKKTVQNHFLGKMLNEVFINACKVRPKTHIIDIISIWSDTSDSYNVHCSDIQCSSVLLSSPSFPFPEVPALIRRLDTVLSSSAVSLTAPLWMPDQSTRARRLSLLMANERCNYSRSAEAFRHRGERQWRVHLDH